MEKPVVKLGHIRLVVEIEPGTTKSAVKRYRTVFTDAVGEDGSVPNEEALRLAVDEVIERTKNEDIDGSILEPLERIQSLKAARCSLVGLRPRLTGTAWSAHRLNQLDQRRSPTTGAFSRAIMETGTKVFEPPRSLPRIAVRTIACAAVSVSEALASSSRSRSNPR